MYHFTMNSTIQNLYILSTRLKRPQYFEVITIRTLSALKPVINISNRVRGISSILNALIKYDMLKYHSVMPFFNVSETF